jgi:hypothetical protein
MTNFLAHTWLRLAEELERAEALLNLALLHPVLAVITDEAPPLDRKEEGP